MPVNLEAVDMSSDELYAMWMDMEGIRVEAVAFEKQLKAEADEAMQSRDPAVKAVFAERMDVLTQHMRVLDAWCSAAHAAWVFSRYGAHTLFFLGSAHRITFTERVYDGDSCSERTRDL